MSLRISYSILVLFIISSALYGQNSGIGTSTPTHTLHIKPDPSNPVQDPLRLEGIQSYLFYSDTSLLVADPATGVLRVMPFDTLFSYYSASLGSYFQLNGSWLSDDGDPEGINISSSGNVGVGTNDPQRLLHVKSTTANAVRFEAPNPTAEWVDAVTGDTASISLLNSYNPSPNDGVLELVGFNGLHFKGKKKTNPDISVLSTGEIELLRYGGGTTTGNETYLLGVEADGSVVEVNMSGFEDIYTKDDTITSNRVVSLNGNTLTLDGSSDIHFTADGKLGIGISSPQAPIHVAGYATLDPDAYISGGDGDGIYGGLQDENVGNASVGAGQNYSIIAEERIAANEFNAYSDRRIKTNIRTSNTDEDLSLLRQLRVADYQYRDQVKNGTDSKKGFIAQEVAELFPQAVTKREGIIPDVYLPAQSWKQHAGKIAITMPEAHGLHIGDQVKLVSEKGDCIVKVSAIKNQNDFVVESDMIQGSSLFVYGRWVNDFHTLDYDEIFMLNVAATQALADEVDRLKQEVAILKTHNQALSKQVKEVSDLQEEVQRIKAMLEPEIN